MPEVRYSFSRISQFSQCPRRFRYRYIDGVKEAFQSVEGFVGQRVHATIEWLYLERVAGREPDSREAVTWYCDDWDRAILGAQTVRVVRGVDSLESHRRRGAELVDSYHRRRFVEDRLETVAVEHHFVVELQNRYSFQGYIDRLARDSEGLFHVIDYKTGRRTPRSFAGKEADQLHAYALAIFKENAVEEVELVLEFLTSTRSLRARVRRSQCEAVEEQLASRIGAIESATVFPPSPGVLCDWCGYNDICDAARTRFS
ncbi:MAG: RecB family exonuclease [Candidatus Binatia bacterium]